MSHRRSTTGWAWVSSATLSSPRPVSTKAHSSSAEMLLVPAVVAPFLASVRGSFVLGLSWWLRASWGARSLSGRQEGKSHAASARWSTKVCGFGARLRNLIGLQSGVEVVCFMQFSVYQ